MKRMADHIHQALNHQKDEIDRLGGIADALPIREEIDAVFRLATEIFGSQSEAALWLIAKPALSARPTPLEMLQTPQGCEIVTDRLYAIRYGFCA